MEKINTIRYITSGGFLEGHGLPPQSVVNFVSNYQPSSGGKGMEDEAINLICDKFTLGEIDTRNLSQSAKKSIVLKIMSQKEGNNDGKTKIKCLGIAKDDFKTQNVKMENEVGMLNEKVANLRRGNDNRKSASGQELEKLKEKGDVDEEIQKTMLMGLPATLGDKLVNRESMKAGREAHEL